MLLKLSDVGISYPGKKEDILTVSGVNLALDCGERLAIVGESGSGKTTVIRAVLGLLAGGGFLSSGKIFFEERNMAELSPEEFRNLRGKDISMIFQDSGNMMNPVHTIGKQYIEYIRLHSDLDRDAAYERAVDMLTMMNLPDPENIMKSYTFELSGGMRQRVGIAMAITFKPKLLLADEPTSALDVTTQAQIVGELMYVTSSGEDGKNAAMIIVTHNIGVAAALSHKLMVMQKGRVVEYGDTETVLKSPQAEYTKNLLAAVPEIGGKRYV